MRHQAILILGILLILAFRHVGSDPAPRPAETLTPTLTATVTVTVTPTVTPTVTAPPNTPPLWRDRQPVVYRTTYYGSAFQGGPLYCGTDIYGRYDLNDPTTIASGAGGPPCGTRLMLCAEGACQGVVVKDACGGCDPHHLDLSRAAWESLGRLAYVEAHPVAAKLP